MFKNLLFVFIFSLFAVSMANAQWSYSPFQSQNNLIVSRMIGDAVVCDAYKKAGRRVLPSGCTKGKASSSSQGQNSISANKAGNKTSAISAKFVPTAKDDSARKFADLGTTPEEKQLLLRIATTTRASFEQQNSSKGWKNNTAGAMTFFIVTTSTIYNGEEVSDTQMNNLFKVLDSTMGESFATASNTDKTELYNTLISYAGLSVVFYANAAQSGNQQQVEKTRQMVGNLVRTILKTEPEDLKGLLK